MQDFQTKYPLLWILLFAVTLLLLWRAWQTLLLVFASVLFAIFLRGLTDWLAAHTRLTGGSAYAAVVATLFAVCGIAIWLLAPRVITELSEIGRTIPKSLTLAQQTLDRYGWGQHVTAVTQRALQTLNLGERLANVANDALEMLAGLVVIVVMGLFLALEPDLYKNGIIGLFPGRKQARVRQLLDALGFTLHWWILGQIVPMVFLGVSTMIVLWVIGVPLAFTLGLFTGAMIFIPYLGAVLAFVPTALVALVQSPGKMLQVLILFLVIHAAEAYLLTPLVQRRAVRLPPFLTILAQVLMLELTGILGLAVATPLAATGLVVTKMLYFRERPETIRERDA